MLELILGLFSKKCHSESYSEGENGDLRYRLQSAIRGNIAQGAPCN